jgi:hypothetical protein
MEQVRQHTWGDLVAMGEVIEERERARKRAERRRR